MKYIKFLILFCIGLILLKPFNTFAYQLPSVADMQIIWHTTTNATDQVLNYPNYILGNAQQFGPDATRQYYINRLGIGVNLTDTLGEPFVTARVKFSIVVDPNYFTENTNFNAMTYSAGQSNVTSVIESVTFKYLPNGVPTGYDVICSYGYKTSTPYYHFFGLSGSNANPTLFFSPLASDSTYLSVEILDFNMVDNSGNSQIIIQNNTIIGQNQQIIQGQQETNNKLDNINGSLKDDNISGAENSADDLINNPVFEDTTGLNNIVSLPLDFINTIGNTCTPFNLTIPFIDTELTLPCFSSVLSSKVPTIYNVLVIVINGFILYRCCLDIFGIVRNAKNPNNDRIEVLDL